MKRSIAHVTTVHQRYDTRILAKECTSLASKGLAVTLFVADGRGDELQEGVRIKDLGKAPGGRIWRFLFSALTPLRLLRTERFDLYHLHDPELIPYGLLLRAAGRRVVYDMHEDLPEQVMEKGYIPLPARRVIAAACRILIKVTLPFMSGIVTVTDYLETKNRQLTLNSIAIKNFPIGTAITSKTVYKKRLPLKILFIGSVYDGRSLTELVRALSLKRFRGKFSLTIIGIVEGDYYDRLRELAPEIALDFKPFMRFDLLYGSLRDFDIGFICDYPYKRNKVGLPIKLFEYMAAGLAVIASDFPLWRAIVDDARCGTTIDPTNEESMITALDRYSTEPGLVELHGRAGRAAVDRTYSWQVEAERLVRFYTTIGVTTE